MRPILTSEEMQRADRLTTERHGIPSLLLMENAARAVADEAESRLGEVAGRLVSVLSGKGNNGGDGAAVARLLWMRGADVRLYVFGKIDDTKGDARVNFEIARSLSDSTSSVGGSFEVAEVVDGADWVEAIGRELMRSDVVIDALFGTGLSRPVEGIPASVVEVLQDLAASRTPSIISVDIPSGLDADSAEPIGPHVNADTTVTFTAPKMANVMLPAASANGKLKVADIGTPSEMVEECCSGVYVSDDSDAKLWLEKTAFTKTSYKKTRGTLLLVVGSRKYSGAAVLAANAAIESGVGMVTVAAPASAAAAISERVTPEVIVTGVCETASGTVALEAFDEVMRLAKAADAVGVGCGLGAEEESTREFVRQIVADRESPMVIDADGLNALSPFSMTGNAEVPLILTPHPGEFLRLTGSEDREVLNDRVAAARSFATEHGVVLVLKGAGVIVAGPDGRAVVVPTGNSGLGKAGNGDNLTGILSGFSTQASVMNVPMFDSAVAACHLAGIAGDIARGEFGRRGMLASDVRRAFPEAMKIVLGGSEESD